MRYRLRPAIALFVALSALSASSAQADFLSLKDGRIFDGVKLKRQGDELLISFVHGDAVVRLADVHEYVADGDAGFEPQTEEEQERFEKGDVKYDGKWMSVHKRDRLVQALIEERRADLEERKAARLWRNRLQEETKNFAFESTVPRHVFESYRDLCEAYYKVFAKEWKIRKPRDVPRLPVKMYSDRDEFRQVTRSGALAFFQFVAPWQLHMYYDRLDAVFTEEVMYHELGHFLQRLIDVDFKYPHWPGESLSEYYGASAWDPVTKKLTPGGIHEGRIVQIRADIEKGTWVKLHDMIGGCQKRNFWDYTWGWSFVHFLMNRPEHAKNFKKFFIGLARDKRVNRQSQSYGKTILKSVSGKDMLEAFKKYMKLRSDEDLIALQREWHVYIEEELPVTSARGLRRAAARARGEGRKQRAKRLYEEAIATGDAISQDYFRYAELLESLNEDDDARKNWQLAVELDPLVPEYYIEWGKSLLEDKETLEEGERLLRLAQDIEPDNFYLERNLEALLKQAEKRARKSKKKKDKEGGEDGEKEEKKEGSEGDGAR